jgi:hypothetical protein
LFLDTAITTDRMRDDKNKASTKLSPTSANKHPSNAQKRSWDKEIPKKKNFNGLIPAKVYVITKIGHLFMIYIFMGRSIYPLKEKILFGITLMTVDAMERVCNGITSFLFCKSILKGRYVFLVLMSFTATATWNVLGLKISFA